MIFTPAFLDRIVTQREIQDILAQHEADLREEFGVKSLALFGSVVRGDRREDSDVDVLVEFDRRVTLFDLGALVTRLEELLQVPSVDITLREGIRPEFRDHILREAQNVF